MDNRVAFVYINDVFAGTLSEVDVGYEFLYDKEYLSKDGATAVSLTLPLTSNPYYSKVLFPFFDGLIPEGWMLDVLIKNWKIDRSDRFQALLVGCKDCIGNVSIRSEKKWSACVAGKK